MSRVLFSTLILVLMTGWISGITPVCQARVLGAWFFNEDKGTVAKDASGNGFDLDVVNTEWFKGEGSFDGALGFSTHDAYAWIEVRKENPEFNLDKGAYTIITRAYITDINGGQVGLPRWYALEGNFEGFEDHAFVRFQRQDYAGWLIHPEVVSMDGVEIPGIYEFSWWWNQRGKDVNGNLGWVKAGESEQLAYGTEWHQFAVTYDEAQILMYLDGEEIINYPIANGTDVEGNPTSLLVGGELTFSRDRCCGDASPHLRTFTGAIDESLIANEAFGPDVIAESAKKGIQKSGAFAVDSQDKLATTWVRLKTEY